MKIGLDSRVNNNYQIKFKTQNKTPLAQTNTDTFSILNKYEKKYQNSYVKDLIPDLKTYLKNFKDIKEKDIKGVLGYGGLSIVFDIGNNKALKCSLENPLEYRKHCPEFDIPFLSPVKKINKTYIVQEAKAETDNLSIDDCKDVISRIKKAGFELSSDMDEYKTRQIGRYNGKIYLLDTRCAVPQPNRFSKFVYKFCTNHRRIFTLRDMQPEALDKYEQEMFKLAEKYGPQVFHAKEAPRKNLSLKEGFSMMWNIMKENIKYRRFPL